MQRKISNRRNRITAQRAGSSSRRADAERRRPGARTGATVVEFAIVANLLMIIILTCMEFARLNMTRNLAQDAAYFAARHALVPGATAAEAQAEADRIMGSMLNTGYTITVDELDENSEDVIVTVDVDLTAVALFAPYFLPDTTISTTARMRTERYDGFYQQ